MTFLAARVAADDKRRPCKYLPMQANISAPSRAINNNSAGVCLAGHRYTNDCESGDEDDEDDVDEST